MALHRSGLSVRQVAEQIGCAPGSVSRWTKMFLEGGDAALDPIPNAGGKARLGEVELAKLRVLMHLGPRACGFATDLWTLRRVRAVIAAELGVMYSTSNVHKLLHRLRLSPQRAVRRAREQDTAEVDRFRREEWPRLKRRARRQGRVLAVADESGFTLQPVARTTWAPRGKTPELVCGARHDRVSAISAITVSPVARRVRFAFELTRSNFNTDSIDRFVRRVQRQVRRPVTFVWDRLPAHRSVAKRHAGDRRFEFVLLPPYAPTLNPDEWVWRYAKHHLLAGACPWNDAELERQVRDAMMRTGPRTELLRSFFRGARMLL